MQREEIKDINLACEALEEDFYALPIIKPEVFLYKENVQRMATAIATNLRRTFEEETPNYTNEQLINYGKQVKSMNKMFQKVVKEKAFQAHKLSPREARRAKIESSINEFGKDLIQ